MNASTQRLAALPVFLCAAVLLTACVFDPFEPDDDRMGRGGAAGTGGGGPGGNGGAGGWSNTGGAGVSGAGGTKPGQGGWAGGGAGGKGGSSQGGSGGTKQQVPEGSVDLGASCSSLFDCPDWSNHGACDDVECINAHCYRVPEPLNKPAGNDAVKGDCQGLVCDGKGSTLPGALDTDVPNTQLCATSACAAGVLTTTPMAAGTSCSKYGAACDGAGMCVGAGTIACSSSFDCPAAPNGCHQKMCDQKTCVYPPRPKDSIATDPSGNCTKLVCDGAGNPVEFPDDTDAKNDGNDCTTDGCSGGQAFHNPKPVGHPCRHNGHYCKADTACVSCPLVSPTCEDYGVGEPDNGNEPGAYYIDRFEDKDSTGYTACGVLSGAGDVDWWKYNGTDTFGYTVDPYQSITAALPLTLCAYFSCGAHTPTLTCSGGATPDVSPGGIPGCCATVTPDEKGFPGASGCAGSDDDDMTVLLKVSNPGVMPCVPYELSVHF